MWFPKTKLQRFKKEEKRAENRGVIKKVRGGRRR